MKIEVEFTSHGDYFIGNKFKNIKEFLQNIFFPHEKLYTVDYQTEIP